mgnify:CR=1 FL=1|tara:strand:+ start:4142 stop:4651 length:510 start_codon:yes stop_codon:yes gene_type:complete
MAIDNNRNLGKHKPAAARGGISRGLLIAIIGLVLVGGGGGGYYYFTTQQKSVVDDESAVADTVRPAIYLDLEPSFIVNFVYKDTLRYLQINISVMTRDQSVIEQVQHHMPAIRHQLLMLLSDKTYTQLSGVASKEKLRLEMLIEIRKIVGTSASGHSVDAVYLTGYVMQ